MIDAAQIERIRATLSIDPTSGTHDYIVANLDNEVVTDELIDFMIFESGGAREAVGDLLRGQLQMLRRQKRLIEAKISVGYDRGRIRPHREIMPIPAGPPPLDLW